MASLQVMLPSGKRKREEQDALGVLPCSSLTIHPNLAATNGQSLCVVPSLLIPRSRLPLSHVDFVGSLPRRSATNLFTADNAALDALASKGTQPLILIARSRHADNLFAIEKVQQRVYSMVKLHNWVKLDGLASLARETVDAFSEWPRSKVDECHSWWNDASLDSGAVEKLFGKKRRLSMAAPAVTLSSSPAGETRLGETSTPNELDPVPTQLEFSIDNLPDTLKTQYLETLYVAKTSLAFYVKGPLTRLRAVMDKDAMALPLPELISALRSRILPLNRMDTKYKDTLPQIIRDACGRRDESTIQKKKKRKSKGNRLGKNGLFSGEEDYVQQWWAGRESNDTETLVQTSIEDEMKDLIRELRKRETKLQIILILEIIALTENHCHGDSQKHNDQESPSQQNKKKKDKTAQDLAVSLDLLIDKLCIWQSVDNEELIALTKSPANARTISQDFSSGSKSQSALRDFCMEVIVPFYASRLPEKCRAISQKLHGTSDTPHKKPHIHKPSTTTPGSSRHAAAPTKRRPMPEKRSLRRVLTDEQRAERHRSVSLARSISDMAMAGLKRESSEIPLGSIASFGRGGIQTAKRIDNREVDLSTMFKVAEAKQKRKVLVDKQAKELKDAINVVKKPHRAFVAGEFADAVERRAVEATSARSRKAKHPTRHSSFGLGVQVMATPSAGHKHKLFPHSQPQPQSQPEFGSPLSPVLAMQNSPTFRRAPAMKPNAEKMIPSSATRSTTTGRRLSDESLQNSVKRPTTPSTFSLIDDTPTKGSLDLFKKFTNKTSKGAFFTPCRTTFTVRGSPSKFKTPKLPLQATSGNTSFPNKTATSCIVESTPTKVVVNSSTNIGSKATDDKRTDTKSGDEKGEIYGEAKEDSIYATLGWDDEDIDELQ